MSLIQPKENPQFEFWW